MGRASSIKRLAPPIKAEVDRILREGATIDEIVAHLRGMGAAVSRSAVGRYKQGFERQLQRYREAQEVASVWVSKLGENPQGDVGRLLAEMLKTVAFQTLAQMGDAPPGSDQADDAPAPATPMDIMLLAKAIKDLEAAAKQSLERELRVRKEVVSKLDDAVLEASAAGEPGLSAERLAQLRRDFLGVRTGAGT